MPPRGVKSAKRKRQYEHIKESAEKRGNPRAEEIAARTVNKQRAQAGQTKKRKQKSAKKSSGGRRKSSSSRGSSASSRKGRKRSMKKR